MNRSKPRFCASVSALFSPPYNHRSNGESPAIAVLSKAADPVSLRAEAYFRFLPPAAYFPVRTGISTFGLSPTAFLEGHTGVGVGRLQAGHLTRLLRESFCFEAIDLDADTFVQLFQVVLNRPLDTDYTFRNKPAEEVFRRFFRPAQGSD